MQSIVILMIEDNPGDIELTRIALKKSKLLCDLHVVQDGMDASDFLFQRGEHLDAPQPDLILLDLNLPRKSGREILEEIKEAPHLNHIPVVVLTASAADEEILRSYNLNPNCYIKKPIGFEEFTKVVNKMNEFWFTIVKLPGKSREPAIMM